MDAVIRNPRRSPRVPLRSEARLEVRGTIRRARLQDVSAGGCLVVPEEELVPGTVLAVLLMREDLEEPLSVVGRVAWSRRALTGVEFAPRAASGVATWVRRLMAANPGLREIAERVPSELSLAVPLFKGGARSLHPLQGDEATFFACADDGLTVSAVLARARLPRERAVPALFGLLAKRVLTISPPEVEEPVPEPLRPPSPASRILMHGVAGANRSPSAQALFGAAHDAASLGRTGQAMALASDALKHAPHDSEIGSFIVALARGRNPAPPPLTRAA